MGVRLGRNCTKIEQGKRSLASDEIAYQLKRRSRERRVVLTW